MCACIDQLVTGPNTNQDVNASSLMNQATDKQRHIILTPD